MADVWASPIYRFRVQDPRDPRRARLIEVVLDVTLSAPSFREPSAAMKRVLKSIVREHLPAGGKILDFGAGKLRNALYLLKRGHNVCGVEFEKLSKTTFGKIAHSQAARYPKFWQMVYPEAFFSNSTKFDIALLINVLNTMPVPSERSLVIQECHKKLSPNGHFLWYSQHGDADYKRRCTSYVRLGDGYYIGTDRRFKTFYREFTAPEMDSIMLANGFQLVRSYSVPNNHVRLYRKSSTNPFSTALSRADLKREIPRDSSIQDPPMGQFQPKKVMRTKRVLELRPDPPALSFETQFTEQLSRLRPGAENAAEYHALIVSMFTYLFVPDRIRKITKEAPLSEGRKRIDIIGRTGETGFFFKLNRDFRIISPYVIVECKNYKSDIKNPEFDQLLGRLSKRLGHFGMIICRHIEDRDTVIKRCKDAISGDLKMFVIVLEDGDLEQLLLARQRSDWGALDDYLDDRLHEILT